MRLLRDKSIKKKVYEQEEKGKKMPPNRPTTTRLPE